MDTTDTTHDNPTPPGDWRGCEAKCTKCGETFVPVLADEDDPEHPVHVMTNEGRDECYGVGEIQGWWR